MAVSLKGIYTMELVSVIVPCYNAVSYIDNLSVFFNQTYSEIEFIVVDDCSSDNSWEKLQELKNTYTDQRVIIYRNEVNLGAGLTRNKGFALSSGQFVCFWDIDDRVEPDFVERMLCKLQEERADFVCCDYFSSQDAQTSDKTLYQLKELMEKPSTEQIKSNVFDNWCAPFPWNKLVRRDFIEKFNIEFPSIFAGEDQCWVMSLVLNANKVAYLDMPLYEHIFYQTSLSSQISDRSSQALFDMLDFKYKYMQQYKTISGLDEKWLFHFFEMYFFFWNKLNSNIELQKSFALKSRDFCQEHGVCLSEDNLKLGSTFPLYRLIPKLESCKELRTELKRRYRLFSYIRKYKAILRIVDLVMQEQQQKENKKC